MPSEVLVTSTGTMAAACADAALSRAPAQAQTQAPAQAHDIKDRLIALLPRLRAFAVALCGNRETADDLVQETVVRAWRSLGSFEQGTNLKAWLFTILRNVYFSELRKRHGEVLDADGLLAARLSVRPSQETHAELRDMEAALADLPAEQREALLLVGAEGLSYEAAARICRCQVGTMKSRVSRARRRLAELLEEPRDPPRPSAVRQAAHTPR